MPVFTFYLHDDQGKVPAFEIVPFDAVAPALDHARKLLNERPRYRFVEIVSEEISVGRVAREASTLRPKI